VIYTAKTQKPSLSRLTCRPHIKAVSRPTYVFFYDQNVLEWPASTGWYQNNNYCETVKYDEKQQTKNQRVKHPSNQVYFMFTILL